jgi:putative ABC transport system ATP-binding protein
MNLLTLNDLHKEYGEGDTLVQAVGGITLQIKEGEFIAILGRSGSGKSTLLSLLSGLEQPTRGYITYQGTTMSTLSEDELALIRRSGIGIVYQHFYLLEGMSALENVELPLMISGKNKDESREWALKILEMVGLTERVTHYPNELSGGEKQRVGIARALVNKAAIVIADEPTGDLDSKKGNEIVDLLFDLNKGGEQFPILDWKPTIIMVTHDINMLRKGMRLILLSDGQIDTDIKYQGDIDQIRKLIHLN